MRNSTSLAWSIYVWLVCLRVAQAFSCVGDATCNRLQVKIPTSQTFPQNGERYYLGGFQNGKRWWFHEHNTNPKVNSTLIWQSTNKWEFLSQTLTARYINEHSLYCPTSGTWTGAAGFGQTLAINVSCLGIPTTSPTKNPTRTPSRNPTKMPTLSPTTYQSYCRIFDLTAIQSDGSNITIETYKVTNSTQNSRRTWELVHTNGKVSWFLFTSNFEWEFFSQTTLKKWYLNASNEHPISGTYYHKYFGVTLDVVIKCRFTASPTGFPFTRDPIRLSGIHLGRLEIYHNNEWGTVCNFNWRLENCDVACKQIGYKAAVNWTTIGGGSGPIWMSNVRCLGKERHLGECRHAGWGIGSCTHAQDVSCLCSTSLRPTAPPSSGPTRRETTRNPTRPPTPFPTVTCEWLCGNFSNVTDTHKYLNCTKLSNEWTGYFSCRHCIKERNCSFSCGTPDACGARNAGNVDSGGVVLVMVLVAFVGMYGCEWF